MGGNAAVYAMGGMPEPVVVPTKGMALGARFHAQVALLYAIETALTQEDAQPEEVEVTYPEAAN